MLTFPHQDLMIDANINRFKEGARVLEDLARFVLNDYNLFVKIKDLKHQIQFKTLDRPLSQRDIGGPTFKESPRSASLLDLAHANALRMQEASRVLEEIYDKDLFKAIRFRSYDIHTEIITKLQLFLKRDKLKGVYAICNPELMSIDKIAVHINQKKISICQVRMKNSTKRQVLQAVLKMRKIVQEQTLIIVNDHLDIALACADGVHLGQQDLPLEMARKIAPSHFIIGVSCHSVMEAQTAAIGGAHYISVGCLYPSFTKSDVIDVALDTLKEIVDAVDVPVCAIGGINASNIDAVMAAKVSMVAMASGFFDTIL